MSDYLKRFIGFFLLAAVFALTSISSAQARFLSPDTYDPLLQGIDINRYSYSGNDPINGSDPNGHQFIDAMPSPVCIGCAEQPYTPEEYRQLLEDQGKIQAFVLGGAAVAVAAPEVIPPTFRMIAREGAKRLGKGNETLQLTPGQAANLQRTMGRTASNLRDKIKVTDAGGG
jgi:hypothetical protein